MLKYQDFHFGNDFLEVVIKAACWAVSIGIIYTGLEKEEPGTLSSVMALSTFVFSASCFSNTLVAIKQKNNFFAKCVHKFFLACYFYVAFFSLLAALNIRQVPEFFVTSLYWIYGIISALMVLDIFLIDLDPQKESSDPTFEAAPQLKKFEKNLG